MDESEFLTRTEYLEFLKNTPPEDTVRSKHYNTLMPSLLQLYPNMKVRDRLDIDGTFSVIMGGEAYLNKYISLYLDVIEYVGTTTYLEPIKTGLVDFTYYTGFWIVFE